MANVTWPLADPGGRAVYGVGLRLLHCWDRGIESGLRHGGSSLGFVACCVDGGLCDELITRSQEPYQMCVRLLACDLATSQRGGLGPICAVAPQKKKMCPFCNGTVCTMYSAFGLTVTSKASF